MSYQFIVGEVSTKEGDDYQFSSMCGSKHVFSEKVAAKVSRSECMADEDDSLAEVHVEEVANQQDCEL